MKLSKIIALATDKTKFTRIEDFIFFARTYLEFTAGGLQARIVCRKEEHYQFWQYKVDGTHNFTRPINTHLMLDEKDTDKLVKVFPRILKDPRAFRDDATMRRLLRNCVYTIQQCIGATLDALPASRSNTARKLNGDLFERLILLSIREAGVECTGGTTQVPIEVDGEEYCSMSYQHDLIIKNADDVRCIGSVKTSSKDRIDKIFIDKFLFNQLTGVAMPHVAIFLNDVQRSGKTPQLYKIRSTFLPGHFKGYTIKLNPLDGVFYCDLRPNMVSDPFLAARIFPLDKFFCEDLWGFLATKSSVKVEIQEDKDARDLAE